LINQKARALIASTNKKLGEGSIVLGSDISVPSRFSTGSLSLDLALGGGFSANQFHEIIGLESHGKTAVSLKTIAANQAVNPDFTTLWIAAEHYDADQATRLGVNNEQVIVIPTQEMELAFEKVLEYAEARAVDCCVIDSYPALIGNEETEKGMEDFVVGIGARLTGKFFRKAGKATRRSLTDSSDSPFLGLFINQWRDQIGGFSPHGTPKTSPGGKAKNYAFYSRVEVKRDEYIVEKRPGYPQGVKVGQVIKATTIKNKSAAPQQVASVDFYFRDAPSLGFSAGDYDTTKEIFTLGVLYGVISRRGSWFDIGERSFNGTQALVDGLRGELDLVEEVRVKVIDAALGGRVEPVTEEDMEAAASAGTSRVKRRARGQQAVEDVPQAGSAGSEDARGSDNSGIGEPMGEEERREES
jgi:recombination protein RecA